MPAGNRKPGEAVADHAAFFPTLKRVPFSVTTLARAWFYPFRDGTYDEIPRVFPVRCRGRHLRSIARPTIRERLHIPGHRAGVIGPQQWRRIRLARQRIDQSQQLRDEFPQRSRTVA